MKFCLTFLKIPQEPGARTTLLQVQTLTYSTASPFIKALVAERQERQVVVVVVFHLYSSAISDSCSSCA